MTPHSTDSTPADAPKTRKPRAPRRAAPAPNPDDTVTMTRAQLEELIARVSGTAVGAAPGSAAVGLDLVKPRSSAVTTGDFLDAVKAIITETRPAEKITVANRVAHNPMNPDNTARKWPKPFFQNFETVSEEDVTPLEYELIPQLKAGLFVKSRKGIPLVEVLVVKRGPQRGIHLRYDNSKADKSLELATYAPTLEVMLQRCISEYATQQKALAARRAAGLPDEEED